MKPLQLSVLPSLRTDEDSCISSMERDGFVDDAVVLAMVTGSTMNRQLADPGELALSANDMDFAGWRLSNALPEHATKAIPRRPAPPVFDEPGLGEPHNGSHRWWLAGLAGALSTMLFSLLLLTLSSREHPAADGISINKPPAGPAATEAATPKTVTSPELTGVSPTE